MARRCLVMMLVLAVGFMVSVGQGEDGAALKAKGLNAWENRADMAQALVAAQAFEQAFKVLPNDPVVGDLAARAWYWLGLNQTDVAKKQEYHMKGYNLAQQIIKVQPKNVGPYYWGASNISRYAQTLGSLQQKTYFSKINPLMDKVKELNPNYFYGAFPRYMAILTVEMSPSLRKIMATFRKDYTFTLEEAEKLCKQAMAMQPNYFLNHTTLAEIYIEMGKKAEAKKELEWVISQDPNVLPDTKPENMFEQRRAKKMLAEIK